MSESSLFSTAKLGSLTLLNRVVMAPMTRCRAVEHGTPNALMAEYYSQRASAGFIITEGTAPSANGSGYARIPGLYTERQEKGWKLVTTAVHQKGGRIGVQLMHCGRIGHPLNLPEGGRLLAPSALAAEGMMYTDTKGPQPHPTPVAMTEEEVKAAIQEFVSSAERAVAAGFDAVELHGANGYLLEQFLSPVTNVRTDAWGGSVSNRIRFVVETARAVAKAIGGEKVGIRLSPYGVNGGMKPYAEIEETYLSLISQMADAGLQYLHIMDATGSLIPDAFKIALKKAWPRTFILAGNFDATTGESALKDGRADLIAFGRPYIANPDLVARMKKGVPLAAANPATFFASGVQGYTDYPAAT